MKASAKGVLPGRPESTVAVKMLKGTESVDDTGHETCNTYMGKIVYCNLRNFRPQIFHVRNFRVTIFSFI